MPGESVSPSRGSDEAEGEREGEREPRRRRRGRRLLLPFPPCRPLCPRPLERAGPCARARVSGRPARERALLHCAGPGGPEALGVGAAARGRGRALASSSCAPLAAGGIRPPRKPVTRSFTWETLRRRSHEGRGPEPRSRDSGALAVGIAHASKSRCPDPRPPGPVLSDLGCSHHPAPAKSGRSLQSDSIRFICNQEGGHSRGSLDTAQKGFCLTFQCLGYSQHHQAVLKHQPGVL
ncbi:uncharacterized protein LOC129656632 isoform X2 [Bubalus kerabau]|uniref:uncharacterized protein LOC129656632 isoform X2 n=1 Tax=Bubalus carabanensis TaxID=3119969 RepID=UPI00244EA8B3|nr:uncharacterized protein LOC129656632 isoform X2 [Bubalus carabanensis]